MKKNIAASILIKGISILSSLLLVPLTLDYVNKELYGIWLTLSSIVVWINFFDIGLTLGLKNRLTEALTTHDYKRGKSLVSTTYFMMLTIFIPVSIVVMLLIPFINWPEVLNVSTIYNKDIQIVLYLLVIFMTIQMFFNVLNTVVSAYQKTAMASLFAMLGQLLSLLLIFILTRTTPPSLIGLAFAISLSPIVILIIFSRILYTNSFKEISPSYKYIDLKQIKDLFNLGIKFFIIQIQVIVLYQSTNIIISHTSGPEAVSQYNIAYKYLGISTMIYNIILTPLWPAFTDAYALKDYAWMNRIYKKMCWVYSIVLFGIIILIALSPYLYHFWVGDKIEIPFEITLCLGIFLAINSWDSLQVYMINGVGTVKLQTYVVLIGLIFHIPLALFLGNKTGTIGVILSMTCINLIYSAIFTTQINKILKDKAHGIWNK
ncbi:lipopolysaccharide biosynthesis protein [Parabacteroides goldsteinii]|uniref:lipopolysaccharide biosynthesis protein n=1 Tax=Parabacteroides goldsteinii TaxID=328812 RepID=UPI00241FF012|nr:oligosaccharide flippase family protein [Parabacteroides goldsteinii]